ncbi:MAG: hypothetical protein A2297_02455 [Elusimicrobia bacterium RIFOXYB2_FULL_48_7]|nr:MAG: hypothetical protein A2297_02455 [Elusimicrobia bacterium RIFOXYB2_FULL_48_7]
MKIENSGSAAFLLISLIFESILFSGCAIKCVHREYLPPITVAVMPMENETTNLNGPGYLRKRFQKRLLRKPSYSAIPLEEVDAKLREIGISDGGQLNAVTPQDLGKKLNVDAVIYGKLLVFNTLRRNINIGNLTMGDTVQAKFKMVDTRTGDILWQDEKGIITKKCYNKGEHDTPLISFDFVGAFFEKLIGAPLDEETEELARIMVNIMPSREKWH